MMVTRGFFTAPLICLKLKCSRKDDFYYGGGGEIFPFLLFPVILISCEWSFCKSLIITHLYSYRQQCVSEDPALCDPTANAATIWAIFDLTEQNMKHGTIKQLLNYSESPFVCFLVGFLDKFKQNNMYYCWLDGQNFITSFLSERRQSVSMQLPRNQDQNTRLYNVGLVWWCLWCRRNVFTEFDFELNLSLKDHKSLFLAEGFYS